MFSAQLVKRNPSKYKGLCLFSLLLLRCSLLRSLQCILRCGAGKSTTLSRWGLGLRDEHETIAWTGDRTFDHEQIVFEVDPSNAEVADGDLFVSHMAGHALAGEYARGEGRGTDRTLHLEHVTVRLGTAAEAVT